MTFFVAMFAALMTFCHASEVKTTEGHAAQTPAVVLQQDPLYRMQDTDASREDVEFVMQTTTAATAPANEVAAEQPAADAVGDYAVDACQNCAKMTSDISSRR